MITNDLKGFYWESTFNHQASFTTSGAINFPYLLLTAR